MKDRAGRGGLRRQGLVSLRSPGPQLLRRRRAATTGPSSPLLDELLGDIDVVVTRSEKEAVLLENELIKKHQPRFNVRLRDDKDFIVLRLDRRHPYPRLEVRAGPAAQGRRGALLRPVLERQLDPGDAPAS